MPLSLDLSAYFTSASGSGDVLVVGSYNPWLVALSLLVAVFTSWMALQISGQATSAISRPLRWVARLTGSLALGCGVWAMHFIGMLAFNLCTQVDYDPLLTAWSMLPSVIAAAVALSLLGRQNMGRRQLVSGGTLVGAGIGAMHYTGMAAMQMPLTLRYDPLMFALSIVVAVLLAILALWVRFGLRQYSKRLSERTCLAIAALVMGCAIAGMHYTGMAAARFFGLASSVTSAAHPAYLAVAVTLLTAALTLSVLAVNGFLRYGEMFRHLRDAEARKVALLGTAVDGVITINGFGVVLEFNASAERIFGWTRAEMMGNKIDVLMADNSLEGYLENYLHTGETKLVGTDREMLARRRDGSIFPIRLSIGHARLVNQDLFVGIVTDITERRAIEQALRDREQQFRSLIDNIPGVAYRALLAPGWPMLFMSERVARLTGYPAAEFIGAKPLRHFADLLAAEDIAQVEQELHLALAEHRPYQLEYRLRDRAGCVHWIWENGSAVWDDSGAMQWRDGVLLDISQRKLAQLEVEKFKAIIASSDDAIISTTLDGAISSWNRGAERIFGYTADEAIGQPASLLIPPDRLQEEADALARLSGGVAHLDTVRRCKDGRLIDISATISPIYDTQGRMIGESKIARDVSERRQMEQDLRDAKDRAEQAAAARAAFLANMSHEIRTPMNAILGFTDVLLHGELDAMQRRHLDTVRNASRSLLRLLNEVLDTAKLDKGVVDLELADFNLLALIDELSSTLGASARNKALKFSIRYASSLPSSFHGDELRMRQVLTNLIGNAIKFTETGGVTLDVAPDDGQLHFRIQDTGIGIPEDRLSAIFDPFTQADASMSRRFGGTGLGTTISKQLVVLMGGRIWVESQLGQGSTFHVLLPLAAARHPGQAPQRQQGAVPLPPLHILAADDVPQNLELLELLLGKCGHSLTFAETGSIAVELAEAGGFDLILMDVQMPDMDGLEATRRIRSKETQQGRPRVPVIALTASVMDADRTAASAAGMDGFATKPIDLFSLTLEMAKVLGIAQSVDLPAPPPPGAPQLLAADMALQRWAGQRQVYQRALAQFAAEQGQLAAALGALAGDADALRVLAHRVKGVAANLGLEMLAAQLDTLERAVGSRNADLPALLTALAAHLADVWPAIAQELAPAAQTLTQASLSQQDIAQAPRLVAYLRQAFQRGEVDDMALAELLAAVQGHVSAGLSADLQMAVDDFDFAFAQIQLDKLLIQVEEIRQAHSA